MIDPRNAGNLTAGLVADPEYVGNSNNVIRFRLASDFAGNDRDDSNNNTGYFSAIYFVNDNNPANKFITSQIQNGNLSKGSQVQVLYRLQQNRWTNQDGKKQSAVELVIESMAYAGSRGGGNTGDSSGGSTTSASTSKSQPAASVLTEF